MGTVYPEGSKAFTTEFTLKNTLENYICLARNSLLLISTKSDKFSSYESTAKEMTLNHGADDFVLN